MTQNQSRDWIRQHLKNRGEELIEVSPPIVLYWWRHLNNAIFNSILDPPTKIVCKNFMNGDLGWCLVTPKIPNKLIMGIRRELDSRQIFMTVLSHEMVHQHTWVTSKQVSHGKHFYKWAPTLRKTLNIQLTRLIDL